MSISEYSINVWENEGGSIIERHERNNKLANGFSNRHQWQYETREGWGDFDPEANKKMQSMFEAYMFDEGEQLAQIKSGKWEYMVDFDTYRQTNIQHSNHRTRKIRQIKLN